MTVDEVEAHLTGLVAGGDDEGVCSVPVDNVGLLAVEHDVVAVGASCGRDAGLIPPAGSFDNGNGRSPLPRCNGGEMLLLLLL